MRRGRWGRAPGGTAEEKVEAMDIKERMDAIAKEDDGGAELGDDTWL